MKYIIFNWKSYLNLSETLKLTKLVNKLPNSNKFKFIYSPNGLFTSLIKSHFPKSNLATQNIDIFGMGANTGSIDISLLKDLKIKFTLLGHSEVRSNLLESDNLVGTKLKQCMDHQITPIVCIGETLSIYKSKKTKSFLNKQISTIFSDKNKYQEVILAYEPIWSIGTGLTPQMSEIEEICSYLTKILKKYSFKKINILYGGSVNLDNIKEILNLPSVDGVLVGSASTKSSFINFFK
jgi:triosephosphate isomerase